MKIDPERALELYYQGKNDTEIAVEFGVCSSAVGYFRKNRGLQSNRIKFSRDDFYRLYQKGDPDYIIAKKLKVNPATIWTFRTTEGLKPHYHKRMKRREKEEYRKQLIEKWS